MGGKGRRRREKNYKAAHGDGTTRLPPPPDLSSFDAVPFKLRKIMSISGAGRPRSNPGKNNASSVTKGIHSEEGTNYTSSGTKRKRNDQTPELKDDVGQSNIPEKKMKNRKRKNRTAHDLRFECSAEPGAALSQRKQRKKQRLKDKKEKHKRSKTEGDDANFPGHEEIRFGDVVEAPPKLLSIPKPFKTTHDASQERLRLQAVEAYRKRKGWESRPGIQLPTYLTKTS